MAELLLIVRLAGRRVALAAREIEAVVEIEGLTPVPGAPAHVAGLAALRSRVLTVIDSRASLGFAAEDGAGTSEAVVVPSGGHTYALLVDQVDDVIESAGEPGAVLAPPGPGWERVAKGVVEVEGDLLLLADPHL
jgi:purine-binding chemotaxis protein CheW